jgi:DNA-binding CsgD family transcriptional regulator
MSSVRAPAVKSATTASFAASLLPMLVADDERRYVDANRAACLLLRSTRESVLRLRIDDLTPPELRSGAAELWDAFLRTGTQAGTFELLMPDGALLSIEYSATANVEPGRHLSVLSFPTSEQEGDETLAVGGLLTEREREVLALVAMGERTAGIAYSLGISPATVETHIRHSVGKLGAKSRTHAVTLGLQRGEIGLQLPVAGLA